MKIVIDVSDSAAVSNVVDYVRLVAEQIDDGYTSGHSDSSYHWAMESNE